MAVVISADEIKKTFSDYSPEKVEELHHRSAKLADKEFEAHIKNDPLHEVVLMNGGTASGKTEFLVTQLEGKSYLILDGTLPSPEGAKIKIKSILKANKRPIIYSVIPDDLGRAFTAFLHRERKFSDSHFYRTHSGSRKTLLWVAENFPKVEVNLIESFYTESQEMKFRKLEFSDKEEQMEYLVKMQMSEADIIEEVNKKLLG